MGLFGGTFDPPHRGHLEMALSAVDQLSLGEVWWVPAKQPPHKQGRRLSCSDHRMAMTREIVRGHPNFRASDLEIQRAGISFTVETVHALKAAMPGCVLFLLMGQDNWRHFQTWHRPAEIRRMATLVVFPRIGKATVGDQSVIVVNCPYINIAASDIRERVCRGLSIRDLVTEEVDSYIATHCLYAER